MARWKLMTPHYLNVKELDGEPVEFVYMEQDLTTMRNRRKSFKVPLLLDPKDASYINDASYGIVVSDGNSPGPRDYIFIDDPTPDMEPIDDEARIISDKFRDKWINPIDNLPSNGDYSQSLLGVFERQLEAMARNSTPLPPTSVAGVSAEDFIKLQEQVALLAARNAELEAVRQPVNVVSPDARR